MSSTGKNVIQSGTFGEYRIERFLGKGVTAHVFLGKNSEDEKKVYALKTFYKKGLKAKYIRNMQTEVDTLAKLDHKNVLKLMGADMNAKHIVKGVSDDVAVLYLELAPNGELLDYLMFSGNFTEKIARTYFRQLVSALEHCTNEGITHRDLKPDNILLDANFQLKLADFGFASEDDTMHTYVGTKSYMAPEVADGKRDGYTRKCDVWSSGVILFIMRIGFPPYVSTNAETDWWFDKLKKGNTERFWAAHKQNGATGLSAEFMDLVNKMLTFDPASRASFKEVSEHKWMRGEILSDQKLKEELLRKKPIMEHNKALDALEAKNTESTGRRAVPRSPVSSTKSCQPFQGTLDLRLPEPPVYSQPLVRCNSVQSASPARQTLEHLVRLLMGMGPGVKGLSREGYEVEASFPSNAGIVTVAFSVQADAKKPKARSVLSMRRLAGPWLQYRRVLAHFENLIGAPEPTLKSP